MSMSKWHNYFFDTALRTSELSHAQRLKVGAVAVRDRRIICCGYNGTPQGFNNQCEDNTNSTKMEVMHAEENLIVYCARKGIPIEGCSLYITHSPCIYCSRLILGSGFIEVFYKENFRSDDGLIFLRNANIEVTKYDEERYL